ncbi:MAG TPA: CoA transferase [Actinocrinis sp.]|nr:CoA transferase [Actinocrinis sp.]
MEETPLPLAGLKVIDVSTLFAGPFAARLLGDFGAEVVKIEQPSGDPLRRYGHTYDDVPLLWKFLSRNKKSVVLDLHDARDQELFLRLAAEADVVVENFRPGTLERWGLGPELLARVNPRLVLARVTAFGQDGPYAHRPGFGTLAEAMSGLAAMSGEPDGPPMLPAFPLGDAVAGLHAALAVLIALRGRDRTGSGQTADISITETLIGALGAQITVYDKLGVKPDRVGNRSNNSAPRNVYRCADGRWVAVSAPAHSVAERIVRLVGRQDLCEEPWFADGAGRARHRDLIDEAVGRWISVRSQEEVIKTFEQADASVAPVYEIDDVLADPQLRARGVAVEVPDSELGTVLMPGLPFRLSATPGRIAWSGPRLGDHTDEVLRPLDGVRPVRPPTRNERT